MDTIDQYRLEHESDDEWCLRRAFLAAHHDRFPRNRLLCLASCFINVECYGCRYPEPVMKLLAELTTGLREVAKHRADTYDRVANSIKFVSAQKSVDSSSVAPAKFFTAEKSIGSSSAKDRMAPVKFVAAEKSIGSSSAKDRMAPVKFVAATKPSNETPELNTDAQTTCSPFSSDARNADCPTRSFFKSVPSSTFTARQKVANTTAANTAVQNCRSDVSTEGTLSVDDSSKLEASFYLLASHMKESAEKLKSIKNDAELLQISADKAKMSATTHFINKPHGGFTCELRIDCVSVASADSANKKLAKHLAFSTAADILRKPFLKIEQPASKDGTPRLVGSDQPFSDVAGISKNFRNLRFSEPTKLGQSTSGNIKSLARQSGSAKPFQLKPKAAKAEKLFPMIQRKRTMTQAGDLSKDFVIMKTMTGAASSTLQASADVNKRELLFEFEDVADYCRCKVLLAGQVIADAVGDGRKTAKAAASEQALKTLSATCHTIILKAHEDVLSDDAMKRTQVLNNKASIAANTCIPDSNVGNKLLKKMGWTGGGVGKDGNRGIEEPVSLDAVVNRAGLGCHSNSADLTAAISRVIIDYLRSDGHDDLVFAPEFTAEERAVIHAAARKHHLRTKSYGQGDDRYLVLSLQRSPQQLLEHIRQCGGETAKYILQPPT